MTGNPAGRGAVPPRGIARQELGNEKKAIVGRASQPTICCIGPSQSVVLAQAGNHSLCGSRPAPER